MKISTSTPRTSQKDNEVEVFSFDSGALFASNEEYASKGITFDILAITFESGKGFEGSDRWSLRVKPQDREVEIMTLGSNPGRDEQMRAAESFIDRKGAISNKRLKKSRNTYYIEDASTN